MVISHEIYSLSDAAILRWRKGDCKMVGIVEVFVGVKRQQQEENVIVIKNLIQRDQKFKQKNTRLRHAKLQI